MPRPKGLILRDYAHRDFSGQALDHRIEPGLLRHGLHADPPPAYQGAQEVRHGEAHGLRVGWLPVTSVGSGVEGLDLDRRHLLWNDGGGPKDLTERIKRGVGESAGGIGLEITLLDCVVPSQVGAQYVRPQFL